jgi:hypothetical protein
VTRPEVETWSAAALAAGAHCGWPFVGCDSVGRVTKLAIVNTNITGVINTFCSIHAPSAFCSLAVLT